mmetsp:Transcript_44631/g.72382  ORF Transcript_44631/g.72382 Transcript_44631/m.72382 type:complete len:229 (+) Transcript_44631:185-871(+)
MSSTTSGWRPAARLSRSTKCCACCNMAACWCSSDMSEVRRSAMAGCSGRSKMSPMMFPTRSSVMSKESSTVPPLPRIRRSVRTSISRGPGRATPARRLDALSTAPVGRSEVRPGALDSEITALTCPPLRTDRTSFAAAGAKRSSTTLPMRSLKTSAVTASWRGVVAPERAVRTSVRRSSSPPSLGLLSSSAGIWGSSKTLLTTPATRTFASSRLTSPGASAAIRADST